MAPKKGKPKRGVAVGTKAKQTANKEDSQKPARKGGKRGRRDAWDGGADLHAQLSAMGLRVREVGADGNCLFRSLSDQLQGDEGLHASLRARIVDYIRDHRADFEPFIEDEEPFDAYVERMGKGGMWGGHHELQAAALLLNASITIHQAGQACWTLQNSTQVEQALHIVYEGGEHYNSVRNADDFAPGKPQPICMRAAAAQQGGERVEGAVHEPDARHVARVLAGTGCTERGRAEIALRASNDDVDQAIEWLIERMAEEPEPSPSSCDGEPCQAPAATVCHASPAHTETAGAAAEIPGAVTAETVAAGDEAEAAPDIELLRLAALALESDSTSAASQLERQAPPGAEAEESASATGSGADLARNARPAAFEAAAQPSKVISRQPSRNKNCPCGSGRKYKNCCRPAQTAAQRRTGTPASASNVPDGGAADSTLSTAIFI